MEEMERNNDLSISKQLVFINYVFLLAVHAYFVSVRKRLRAHSGESKGLEELIGEIQLSLDRDSLRKWLIT